MAARDRMNDILLTCLEHGGGWQDKALAAADMIDECGELVAFVLRYAWKGNHVRLSDIARELRLTAREAGRMFCAAKKAGFARKRRDIYLVSTESMLDLQIQYLVPEAPTPNTHSHAKKVRRIERRKMFARKMECRKNERRNSCIDAGNGPQTATQRATKSALVGHQHESSYLISGTFSYRGSGPRWPTRADFPEIAGPRWPTRADLAEVSKKDLYLQYRMKKPADAAEPASRPSSQKSSPSLDQKSDESSDVRVDLRTIVIQNDVTIETETDDVTPSIGELLDRGVDLFAYGSLSVAEPSSRTLTAQPKRETEPQAEVSPEPQAEAAAPAKSSNAKRNHEPRPGCMDNQFVKVWEALRDAHQANEAFGIAGVGRRDSAWTQWQQLPPADRDYAEAAIGRYVEGAVAGNWKLKAANYAIKDRAWTVIPRIALVRTEAHTGRTAMSTGVVRDETYWRKIVSLWIICGTDSVFPSDRQPRQFETWPEAERTALLGAVRGLGQTDADKLRMDCPEVYAAAFGAPKPARDKAANVRIDVLAATVRANLAATATSGQRVQRSRNYPLRNGSAPAIEPLTQVGYSSKLRRHLK